MTLPTLDNLGIFKLSNFSLNAIFELKTLREVQIIWANRLAETERRDNIRENILETLNFHILKEFKRLLEKFFKKFFSKL